MREYQFKFVEANTEERAVLCEKGFHACEYPLDVFEYYRPANSRFFKVDLDATTEKHNSDTKRVGKSIKFTAEIGIPGLAKAAVEYIKERIDNTGDQSAATNTGDRSAATNTGDQSVATAKGVNSVAIVTGFEGKARGAFGCVLVLIERDCNYKIVAHTSVMVDGIKYMEMVYYTLKDGVVVEVK